MEGLSVELRGYAKTKINVRIKKCLLVPELITKGRKGNEHAPQIRFANLCNLMS